MLKTNVPCSKCPFNKKIKQQKGKVGGRLPEVFISQASLPFLLSCHKDPNYKEKETDFKKTGDCAGASIFRSNIDVAKLMPEGISILPENKQDVFATKEEFLAYYYDVSEELVKVVFTEEKYKELQRKELNDAQVKYYNTKTLERI